MCNYLKRMLSRYWMPCLSIGPVEIWIKKLRFCFSCRRRWCTRVWLRLRPGLNKQSRDCVYVVTVWITLYCLDKVVSRRLLINRWVFLMTGGLWKDWKALQKWNHCWKLWKQMLWTIGMKKFAPILKKFWKNFAHVFCILILFFYEHSSISVPPIFCSACVRRRSSRTIPFRTLWLVLNWRSILCLDE